MQPYLVGLRSSPLSRAQLKEIDFSCTPLYFKTTGDLDRKTSLRSMGKSDFFTREIDEALLEGKIRLALHSAKDLPDPLSKGLMIAAITKGVDPSDSLVLHTDNPKVIGTSSVRREEAVKKLYPNATFLDIRGTIEERLANPQCDGVVIAEAALIRLGLNPRRVTLPGKTVPYQGQLAVVIREDDFELKTRLAHLDTRKMHRRLYLGLTPRDYHFPVIRIEPREIAIDVSPFSHVIYTSKSLVPLIPVGDAMPIAVGQKTAEALGCPCLIAEEETAEGVVKILKTLDNPYVLYPHSARSRSVISDYLTGIRHKEIIAYDTVSQVPFDPPPLDPFDEIFFTSPSTVDAFLEVYGALPNKQLTAQGEITRKHLESFAKMASNV